MQETGTTFKEYNTYYDQEWAELMGPAGGSMVPLQDCPNGSVRTTLMISYNAISAKDETAANLLLLWAHLDNKDLWFELFEPVRAVSTSEGPLPLPQWFDAIAAKKLRFATSMKLLLDYSVVEKRQDSSAYSTHPVVHRWAFHVQHEEQRRKLFWLATMIIATAAMSRVILEANWALHHRLLPHAHICSERSSVENAQWLQPVAAESPAFHALRMDMVELVRKIDKIYECSIGVRGDR